MNQVTQRWKPNVTVAAVIKKDQCYLLVEENAENRTVYNQPAGHLEQGESLIEAAKREVLEETAWTFEPQGIVGLYLYPNHDSSITYLRVCFFGEALKHDPNAKLDDGIIRAEWLSCDEIIAEKTRLRSPMVLECINDFEAGQRFPLSIVHAQLQGIKCE